MKQRIFEEEVRNALQSAGFKFQTRVALGGVQPDFVVTTPNGRVIVIEAKAWERTPGFAAHAEEQADHYRALSGADAALVVVKGLERSRRSAGVVTLEDLVDALQEEFGKGEGKPQRRSTPLKATQKSIFAAMPFSREYEDTYFVAMASSAESVGAVCHRVDQEQFVGDVMERIELMIRDAAVVVADFSEAKPNVFYEAGFARGIGKPVVAICSTPLKELPFDVSHLNIIEYGRGQTHKLRTALRNRLSALVSNA